MLVSSMDQVLGVPMTCSELMGKDKKGMDFAEC